MSDPPISSYSYDSSNGVTTYYGGGLSWTQTYDYETGAPIRSYLPTSPVINSTTPPVITIPSSDQGGNALVLGAVAAAATGAGLVASSTAGAAEGAVASSTAATGGSTSMAEQEEARLQQEFEQELQERFEEVMREQPALARMSNETIVQTIVGGSMLALLVGSGILSSRVESKPLNTSVVVMTPRPVPPNDPNTHLPLIPDPEEKPLFVDPDFEQPPVFLFTSSKKRFRKHSLFFY